LAGEVGLDALKSGGNAIDAACATAMALAVTYPPAGNIGGGGFALVYIVDSQKVYYIDFRETAPALSESSKYLNAEGKVDLDKAFNGPLAAGTPGTVAGLFEMHRRFGSQPWGDLVRPARFLADTGFVVEDWLASTFAEMAEELAHFPATAAIFLPSGTPPSAGDRLIQSDLGTTLSLIEANGPDGFYQGITAGKIATYCAENGGTISFDDLAGYAPKWREPILFQFRYLDVYASGLPSSGGIVMGQILSILDKYELERYTADSPEYMHLFTEAARRAFADREEYLGDPDFVDDLSDKLLDESYIATRITSINPDQASLSSDIFPGLPKRSNESDETTHLVAADSHGNIVSLSYTINDWFGSKAVVPGCGFLLNNEMDDFAILPGSPNVYGLIGGEANKIEPGKRMLSSMTPTIILKGDQPYLAVGSPR
jgi:gamma-glutamyltranspeptidase/glutathione hydrolase